MAEAPKIKVLGFYTRYGKDPKTGARSRAIDYVEFAPAQALNAQITSERVEFLRPPESDDSDDDTPNRALSRQYMDALWSVIGPAYDAWKKGYEIPSTGTALAAWSGVTRDQAEALRKGGIYTVEDLSSLDDNKLNRIPMPNAREVRDLARKYLDTGDGTRMAERVTDLEEKLAAAMELLEQQAASEPKRGPGRPRKEEAEAA